MLRTTCPICASSELRKFLERKGVPVHQNLLVPTLEAACGVARGDLELAVCFDCGFVFNQHFEPGKLEYGRAYDNTQTCSGHFEDYVDGIVTDLVENQGVNDCRIVEVGCGKGHFLKKLVEYPRNKSIGFGFDPSYIGPATASNGRINFYKKFFDDSCTDIQADVVVCRHVIEHVPEPLALLRSVRSALGESKRARVFFETPCVDWILRNYVIWDFFYEHCSLFSSNSLSSAFELSGFEVKQVRAVFGGQYLWLEARLAGQETVRARPVQDTHHLATQFQSREFALRQELMGVLRQKRLKGKLAIWGAGAKGVTLANLLDPACEWVDCIIDLNPEKQHRFLPGTGHPILPPEALANRGIQTVFLMNPNYRDEVLELLAKMNSEAELIDWRLT